MLRASFYRRSQSMCKSHSQSKDDTAIVVSIIISARHIVAVKCVQQPHGTVAYTLCNTDHATCWRFAVHFTTYTITRTVKSTNNNAKKTESGHPRFLTKGVSHNGITPQDLTKGVSRNGRTPRDLTKGCSIMVGQLKI